ncbi:hypothetical protein AB0C51_03390 [Streptomyces pathocidini]|uniref:hypothetical protein n=1 Tax=Streptomyces pathocidini TaxID=1650571 RepID=UPI00340182CB
MRSAVPSIGTVLLDVNGTLLPAGSSAHSSRCGWDRLRDALGPLHADGLTVGLCSDSPLEQLREFGRQIGLGTATTFPVVAENGNVISLDGGIRVMAPFPAAASVRALISEIAAAHGLEQLQDAPAPEFGGTPVTPRTWAFGENRRASVSVFAPPSLVTAAARALGSWALDHGIELGLDRSPRRCFLGVHPYTPYRTGKRRTLEVLAGEGHRPLMVGDSLSDWVPPGRGVRCAFVGDATVPEPVRASAWFASTLPGPDGVVDVLRRVAAMRRATAVRRATAMRDRFEPCREEAPPSDSKE